MRVGGTEKPFVKMNIPVASRNATTQQGMAAPEAAHGAIVVRARAHLAEPESHIE